MGNLTGRTLLHEDHGKKNNFLKDIFSNFCSIRFILIGVTITLILITGATIITTFSIFFSLNVQNNQAQKSLVLCNEVKEFTISYFDRILYIAKVLKEESKYHVLKYRSVYTYRHPNMHNDVIYASNVLNGLYDILSRMYSLEHSFSGDHLGMLLIYYDNFLMHMVQNNGKYVSGYFLNRTSVLQNNFNVPIVINNETINHAKLGGYHITRNESTMKMQYDFNNNLWPDYHFTPFNKDWFKVCKNDLRDNPDHIPLVENVIQVGLNKYAFVFRINDHTYNQSEYAVCGGVFIQFENLSEFFEGLGITDSIIVLINSDTHYVLSGNTKEVFGRREFFKQNSTHKYYEIYKVHDEMFTFQPLTSVYKLMMRSNNVNDDFNNVVIGQYYIKATSYSILEVNVTFVQMTHVYYMYGSLFYSLLVSFIICSILFIISSIFAIIFGVSITKPLYSIITTMKRIKEMDLNNIKIGKSFLREVRTIQTNLRWTIDELINYKKFLPSLLVKDKVTGVYESENSMGSKKSNSPKYSPHNNGSNNSSDYESGQSSNASDVSVKNIHYKSFNIGLSQSKSNLLVINLCNFNDLINTGNQIECVESISKIIDRIDSQCSRFGRIMKFDCQNIVVAFSTIGRLILGSFDIKKFIMKLNTSLSLKLVWKMFMDSGVFFQGVIGNSDIRVPVIIEGMDYSFIFEQASPNCLITNMNTMNELINVKTKHLFYFSPSSTFITTKTRIIPFFYIKKYNLIHVDSEWMYEVKAMNELRYLNSLAHIVEEMIKLNREGVKSLIKNRSKMKVVEVVNKFENELKEEDLKVVQIAIEKYFKKGNNSKILKY